ncbi:hypothetical protein ABHI18_007557 [Aspergillus niger]
MTPGRDVQSETVTRGSSEAFRRSLCYVDAASYLNNSPEKESKGAQDSSSYMGCGRPHSREKSTSTTVLGVDKRDAGSIALDELAGLCPANGFTAANSERSLEFHRRFRDIPDRDMLAEDYGCALQKEIICAGRVYISDGHICFRSNILGWSTSLIVRFADVVAIEKTSTAMIFPNAITVLTSHDRHVFRSLRNREATYMLLTNIWKTNIPAFRTPTEGRARISRDGDYLSRDRGMYQSTGSIEEHCLLAEAAIADELIRSLTAAVISRDHTDAPLIKVESTGNNGDAHGQSDGSIIARLLSWRDFRNYPALFQHKFLRLCVVVAWVWTALTSLETLQTHVHHNALPNPQSRHLLSCPHDRASMVQLESDPILEGSFGRLGHWEHNSCRLHLQDLRERMDTDAWSDEDLDNAIWTERIRLAALEGFVWNRDYKRNG